MNLMYLNGHFPDLQGVGEGIEPEVVVCLVYGCDGHSLLGEKNKNK